MNNDRIEKQRNAVDGANSEPEVRQLQLIRAGSAQLGIFTDEVATIAEWRKPTPLPHAPRSVMGVVSIQGRMLTVLDLAALVDREAAPDNRSRQHIIALRGDEQLALAVEAVGDIVEIADGGFGATGLVRGIINHAGSEVSILNVKELFPTAIQGRERRRRRF